MTFDIGPIPSDADWLAQDTNGKWWYYTGPIRYSKGSWVAEKNIDKIRYCCGGVPAPYTGDQFIDLNQLRKELSDVQ